VPGALGPRFLIEAGFIIAVAVVAGVERFRTLTIIVVVGSSWLVVAAVELGLELARRRAGSAAVSTPTMPAPELPVESTVTVRPSPAVRVLRAEAPIVSRQPEPEPAPEPEVTPGPSPEPEPETAPEEAPAPEPPRPVPEQPRILAVAPPPPEPEPEPEPEPVLVAVEPERATAVVPLAPRRVEPREWNLWELERIVREQSGADVARDEERSFLLMYLREFASPDGLLPADFDSVVRESFGDALDAIPW
jgi:hypothetical protein